MKIYWVLMEDRHVDPDVALFRDRDKAIRFAKDFAHEEDGWEIEEYTPRGWHYAASWGEGNSVSVREVELD